MTVELSAFLCFKSRVLALMNETFRRFLRRFIRAMGFEFQRFPGSGSLPFFLRSARIDTVLDVGANVGQTGMLLRDCGFRGHIISFEPLSAPFAILQSRSRRDPSWSCYRWALGNDDGTAEINVAEWTVYSSFLSIKPAFVSGVDRKSEQMRREIIQVRRLDSIWPELRLDRRTILLKVDTQGFERSVLDGAASSLPRIAGIQLEMSIRAIYDRQPTYIEMFEHLNSLGYAIAGMTPGLNAPDTGELLEFDCLFVRVR